MPLLDLLHPTLLADDLRLVFEERPLVEVQAMLDANWEIASHGLKWIDYRDIPRDGEREHLLTVTPLLQ